MCVEGEGYGVGGRGDETLCGVTVTDSAARESSDPRHSAVAGGSAAVPGSSSCGVRSLLGQSLSAAALYCTVRGWQYQQRLQWQRWQRGPGAVAV